LCAEDKEDETSKKSSEEVIIPEKPVEIIPEKPDVAGALNNFIKEKMVPDKKKEKKSKKPKNELEDNVELLLD